MRGDSVLAKSSSSTISEYKLKKYDRTETAEHGSSGTAVQESDRIPAQQRGNE